MTTRKKSKTRTRPRNPLIPAPTEDEDIGTFFLDSGAHSLYTKEVIKKKHAEGYSYYDSDHFWKYVDDYATFIKNHPEGCEFYANVDAIFNPEKSWEVLKYLENEHGLNPVPVIHWGTPFKWIDKHLDAGYTLIGLGGLGQEAPKKDYHRWADDMFNKICPPPSRLPIVRCHGFAMTAYDLLIRYPWWSVDSASWVKAGGFGMVYVPHKRRGEFIFEETIPPYNIAMSEGVPAADKTKPKKASFGHRKGPEVYAAQSTGKHYNSLTIAEKAIVNEWLEKIGVPLGRVDKRTGKMVEWGVLSHHGARKIANLQFFEALVASLPEYPWPFKVNVRSGFGFRQ